MNVVWYSTVPIGTVGLEPSCGRSLVLAVVVLCTPLLSGFHPLKEQREWSVPHLSWGKLSWDASLHLACMQPAGSNLDWQLFQTGGLSLYSRGIWTQAHSKSLGGQFLRQNLRTTIPWTRSSYCGLEAGKGTMQVVMIHDNLGALKAGDSMTSKY